MTWFEAASPVSRTGPCQNTLWLCWTLYLILRKDTPRKIFQRWEKGGGLHVSIILFSETLSVVQCDTARSSVITLNRHNRCMRTLSLSCIC